MARPAPWVGHVAAVHTQPVKHCARGKILKVSLYDSAELTQLGLQPVTSCWIRDPGWDRKLKPGRSLLCLGSGSENSSLHVLSLDQRDVH